jgi:hypothetical protein
MMLRTSYFQFLFSVTLSCFCVFAYAQPYLRSFPSNGAFGYINSVGVFVIPAIFREASPFSAEGIAHVVDQNRKHGYIDTKGKFVIAPRFDDLESSYRPDSPMRVAVGKFSDARYGFINAVGDFVVPAIYDNAYVFRNGFARVTIYGEGPYGQRSQKHGFVNTHGKLAILASFDDARSFGSNGLAAVRVGELWGFINTKGEFAIEPRFDDVPDSPESIFDSFGLARVRLGKNWFLIDAQGKQVGLAEGSSIGKFNEDGLAVIGQNHPLYGHRAGVVNTKGEYVFEPQFDNFLGYKNGFAQIELNGKWGYIDSFGKIVVAPRFPIYGRDFDAGGTAQVVLEIKRKPGGRTADIQLVYGYINRSGKLILRDSQYDEIVMPYNAEGFAVVRKGEKKGFVNKEGEEAVGWFDDAINFSKIGLAAIKQGDKWGYVDQSGNVVVRPSFDRAFTFSGNGIALVELSKKLGHINTQGEFITQPIYEKLGLFESDGLASATLNGAIGFVERGGKFTTFP